MDLSACFTAREELSRVYAQPRSAFLPHGSPNIYFPLSRIQSMFEASNRLQEVFLCDCSICVRDSSLDLEERNTIFQSGDLTTRLSPYYRVYALLIWNYRAGLIHLFLQHQTYLDGDAFFNQGNLEFLREAGVAAHETIIRDILREQYSFQVRVLNPCFLLPTIVSSFETLPIVEDNERRGQGDFGQVYGFEFQYDEYRAQEFREQGLFRFARKIFEPKDDTSGVREWFAIHHLARHDHLMPALGAFYHGPHFFILLEEASETLGSYLKSDGTRFNHQQLWKQVQGLADGLAHLHGTNKAMICYHRDLKPENILIVRETMKIADFGLLQFKAPGPFGDSNGSGVNSVFDSRAYAAPAREDGRYTRAMDVWSLGAIISEIATFDLEGKEGVQRYRAERKQDMETERDFASLRFHNYGRMKHSVRNKHQRLRDKVERCQNPEKFDSFQQQFFREPFFKMVEEMLWDGIEGCPAARVIAPRLSRLQYLADNPQTPGQENIWRDLAEGMLTSNPSNSNCRLRATLLKDTFRATPARCVLLLHESLQNRALLLRCLTYDSLNMRTYEVRETFMQMNQKYPSFRPDYASNPNEKSSFNVTLRQPDKRYFTYEFFKLRDVLNLQAAMIKQYAYEYKSYHLASFIIPKRGTWPRQPRPVIELTNAAMQLWSEESLQPDQELWKGRNKALLPRMHVAILSMETEKLVLIRVTSDPECRQDVSERHTIVLGKAEIYELSIRKGIPMHIPEPANGYKGYREARLRFSGPQADDDVKNFLNELIELKAKWQELRHKLAMTYA